VSRLSDELGIQLELANGFRDALAAAISGTRLTAVWDTRMPWLGVDGDHGTGYWVGCGLREEASLPADSWRTSSTVSYLETDDAQDAISSSSVLDIYMAGTGARDPRMLAAMTAAAVLGHQAQPVAPDLGQHRPPLLPLAALPVPPAAQPRDDFPAGPGAALRNSLRSMLSPAARTAGLDLRWRDESPLWQAAWLSYGGTTDDGYWAGCDVPEDLDRYPWPTVLYVSRASTGGEQNRYLIDLLLTGTGARDTGILTAAILAAIGSHHAGYRTPGSAK
jgi:hypothetical protein